MCVVQGTEQQCVRKGEAAKSVLLDMGKGGPPHSSLMWGILTFLEGPLGLGMSAWGGNSVASTEGDGRLVMDKRIDLIKYRVVPPFPQFYFPWFHLPAVKLGLKILH